MDTLKKEEKLSLSYYLFFTAVIFVFLNFLRIAYDDNGDFVPYIARTFLYLSGPILLLLTSVVALLEGQHKRLKKHYWAWILIIHAYLLVLFINGVVIHQNNFRFITFDLLLFSVFLPGILIGAKQVNWKGLDRLILTIFILNALLLLPYISSFSDVTSMLRNSITESYNQTPYHLWGGLIAWPYFFFTMKDRSSFARVMTIVATGLYFLFALIFLKRAPVVSLFIFSMLLLYANRFSVNIKLNLNKFLFFIFSIFLLIIIFQFIQISPLLDRLSERFYESGSLINTLTKDNRILYDVGLVSSQLSFLEFVMGKGLGGILVDIKNNYPDAVTHSLHNYMALVVMKGGFLFVLVWYYGWIRFFLDFLSNKDKDNLKYFIPILIPLLLSWVFGFVNMSVTFLLLLMGAGKMMAKKESLSK